MNIKDLKLYIYPLNGKNKVMSFGSRIKSKVIALVPQVETEMELQLAA